jgi:hypothetical protein
MKRERSQTLTLRRDALAARATLQRLELGAALGEARPASLALRAAGGLAARLAGSGRSAAEPGGHAHRARPWLLTTGWLALRALRASPTARWLIGAAAVGGAVWWVAHALRTPAPGEDDSG